MESKKKKGCLIPCLIIIVIFGGALIFGISQIAQNPEAYQAKSVLAKELGLSSDQEATMIEIFSKCGIGEITSVTEFQSGEDHTSYHLDDEETAFYSGADNTIVVWVDNDRKVVEAIYFHDQDIYLNGEVLDQVTNYYVNSENRSEYRVAAQMAVKELLNYPDTANFPAISGWAFGVEENTVVVQSSVTSKNAFSIEDTLDFQVKFDSGNIISLILDGVEYIQQ